MRGFQILPSITSRYSTRDMAFQGESGAVLQYLILQIRGTDQVGLVSMLRLGASTRTRELLVVQKD